MELDVFGTLPRVLSAADIAWLWQYLETDGYIRSDRPARRHISDRYPNWKIINQFLSDKFAPILGKDYKFCYMLSNVSNSQEDMLHTDMCLRLSTLPEDNDGIPYQEQDQQHYTIFVCHELIYNFGNHKPLTYIFENSVPGFIDAPGYGSADEIDPSWPAHEMDEQALRDLEHQPLDLVNKFKIIGRLEQEPQCINYWRSNNYHINDAYGNRGVAIKKFLNIMVRKIN